MDRTGIDIISEKSYYRPKCLTRECVLPRIGEEINIDGCEYKVKRIIWSTYLDKVAIVTE